MQQQTILQINLSYDQPQDRLLLKAAVSEQQEIQVWLTYRIARQMFKVLNQDAHLPQSATTMATSATQTLAQASRQFEVEAEAVRQLDALDFDTAYQERSTVVNTQTLLAVETRFVSINDQLNHMQLVCDGGTNINMNLTPPLVLAMTRMLMMASQHAGWTLPTSPSKEPEAVSSIVVQVESDKQVLH